MIGLVIWIAAWSVVIPVLVSVLSSRADPGKLVDSYWWIDLLVFGLGGPALGVWAARRIWASKPSAQS